MRYGAADHGTPSIRQATRDALVGSARASTWMRPSLGTRLLSANHAERIYSAIAGRYCEKREQLGSSGPEWENKHERWLPVRMRIRLHCVAKSIISLQAIDQLYWGESV